MTEFMQWLRVELLRLRSFDWGTGSWTIHDLKDGVLKLSSSYSIGDLATKLGIPEEDILTAIDSYGVVAELEAKSFTLSWREDVIHLSWLEEGICDWKTNIAENYYEEDGQFYVDSLWTESIIYLDGTERMVKKKADTKKRVITEAEFRSAAHKIRSRSV